MASKSLTALPSVVSIVAEKTVVALRCHTRGFEKVLWPILAIILTAGALICFAVAAGTPMWVQVSSVSLYELLDFYCCHRSICQNRQVQLILTKDILPLAFSVAHMSLNCEQILLLTGMKKVTLFVSSLL